MKKLRIIKLVVQPVAVVDDDETGFLTEVPLQPIAVAFKDWQAFADTGLAGAIAQLDASLNAADTMPSTSTAMAPDA